MFSPFSPPKPDVRRSLVVQARRNGAVVDETTPIAELLAAIDHRPAVDHEVMLTAAAVFSNVLRLERSLTDPDTTVGERLRADRSF